MQKENPFTLTFGRQPDEMITRYESMNLITDTFTADSPVSQSYLIEGIRGSGKTVLMTAVSHSLQDDNRWVVVNLNPTMDLLSEFALRLGDTCKKIPKLLQKGFNLSVHGIGVGVGADTQVSDPVGTITELLKQCKAKNKRVLITIDEVQHDQTMRVFASQFQIFVREDYPVFLLMTGLYEQIYSIQNDPALTFLLRAPKIRMEPLSLMQIRKRYQAIFQETEEVTAALTDATKGYAFAFQALGTVYWDYRKTKSFDEILGIYDDMLDDFVYKKIWEGLSGKDREIMLHVTDEENKVSDLCEAIAMSAGTFSKYRDKLINRGILISTRHGYVAPALPRFSSIIRNYEY